MREPMAIGDVFADCFMKTERLGPCTRIYLTVSAGEGKDARSEVVARIIVPTDQLALMGLYLINEAKAVLRPSGTVSGEVVQ